MQSAALWLALAALTASPAPQTPSASEAHICWIADVRKSGDGVQIAFFRNGPGFVDGPAGSFRPAWSAVDPARPNLALLDARIGDRLQAGAGPEDNCLLEIIELDGQVAVRASSTLHPADGPSVSTTEVIPARE